MKQMLTLLIAVLAVAVGTWIGLSGVSDQHRSSLDRLGGDFTLTSDKGPVSLHDFRGKVVALYFGYTHCPDVCITSLNKIVAALKLLDPKQRAQVQAIFISVDPERDAAERVGNYVRFFDPSLIGLSGTPQQLAKIAKRYAVVYQKVAMQGSAMEYAIDHSSIVYVIGRDGKLDARVQHGQGAADLARALQAALQVKAG